MLRLGIAAKSKAFCGREPRRLDPAFYHAPFAVDEFQLDKAGQELDVVPPLGGTDPGLPVIFPQDGRQLQLLQLVVQQDLRRFRHDAPPAAVRHM